MQRYHAPNCNSAVNSNAIGGPSARDSARADSSSLSANFSLNSRWICFLRAFMEGLLSLHLLSTQKHACTEIAIKYIVLKFNLVHDCINVPWRALLIVTKINCFTCTCWWLSTSVHCLSIFLVILFYDVFSCNCVLTMLRN